MERLTTLQTLFPPFLKAYQDGLAKCRQAQLPMGPWETWRYPTRQLEQWRKGRETLGPHATYTGDPEKLLDPVERARILHLDPKALGSTTTKAKPFWSFHQFGMAADTIFFVGATKSSPGTPSWDEPERGMWDRYTEVMHAVGLRTLSFERPHVEWPCAIDALRRGEYPKGASPEWESDLLRMIDDGRRAGLWTPPPADPRPGLDATAA